MVPKVQSSWWVIYHVDAKTGEYRYLLVKRFALSKKIEWIAPKWKIQPGETPEQTALREIYEEVGLTKQHLQIKQLLDTISLQLYTDAGELWVDKDITYYLVKYDGDPDAVKVADTEWFLGMHKWATIQEVLWLVIYKDLREVFRKAHQSIWSLNARDSLISKFF